MKRILIPAIVTLLAAILAAGSAPWWWPWKKSDLDSPCSISTNNQSGGKNEVHCDTGFPKPKIEFEPFEINTLNSELGFDSVYKIKIISDYVIPTFSLKIKLPPSVNEMTISKGWMNTKTEDIFPDYIAGYASFKISNAGGEYYLVFSNKKEIRLTSKDLTY